MEGFKEEFIITSVGQLVFLFTWDGKFINVWNSQNLKSKRNKKFNIFER